MFNPEAQRWPTYKCKYVYNPSMFSSIHLSIYPSMCIVQVYTFIQFHLSVLSRSIIYPSIHLCVGLYVSLSTKRFCIFGQCKADYCSKAPKAQFSVIYLSIHLCVLCRSIIYLSIHLCVLFRSIQLSISHRFSLLMNSLIYF